MVHGLRETASKQRCCTRLTCRSLTAVCARLTLRARAPMLVAHRRRREKMAPGMCAPMAVRSSPCDPSSCTDLISSQTTFYLSQTRAESLVLTWSIFPVAPVSVGVREAAGARQPDRPHIPSVTPHLRRLSRAFSLCSPPRSARGEASSFMQHWMRPLMSEPCVGC